MFQKGVLVGVVLKRPDLPDRLQMRGVVERPQYSRAVGVPVDLAEGGEAKGIRRRDGRQGATAAGAPARAAAERSRRPATQAAAFRPTGFLIRTRRRGRRAPGRGTDWHGAPVPGVVRAVPLAPRREDTWQPRQQDVQVRLF